MAHDIEGKVKEVVDRVVKTVVEDVLGLGFSADEVVISIDVEVGGRTVNYLIEYFPKKGKTNVFAEGTELLKLLDYIATEVGNATEVGVRLYRRFSDAPSFGASSIELNCDNCTIHYLSSKDLMGMRVGNVCIGLSILPTDVKYAVQRNSYDIFKVQITVSNGRVRAYIRIAEMSKIIDKDKMKRLIDEVRNKLDTLSRSVSTVKGEVTDLISKLMNKNVWFPLHISMDRYLIGGDDFNAWVLSDRKEMISYSREDDVLTINICNLSRNIIDAVGVLKSVFMDVVEVMSEELIEVLGEYYKLSRTSSMKPKTRITVGEGITVVLGEYVAEILIDDVTVAVGEDGVIIHAKSKGDAVSAVGKLNSNVDKLWSPVALLKLYP